ncbi:MAG: protein kinase [Myxococcota bacterium]|nr:protein kinase [Myxococcota bacterium]
MTEAVIFGKYQLLEILGRGGMAEVFKAKSYGVEGFEKLLVIKRILPNLTSNERFVDMFINEAKIAVSLNHANIVQVFDLGKVADSYYIAMEHVHGMDLSTTIKTCQRLGRTVPIELAAFIGSEVAKGLDYAHRRRDQHLEPLNIIHRDISPHNILISHEGEVKITDFGIAQAKNAIAGDETHTIKGKNAYMAPEQARGKDHDRRVDIFALGVVLYEAISGTNPFRKGQVSEILRRIQKKTYQGLADACPFGVPEEISEIVAKAMEPDADMRYIDAGEFYEALIAFLYNTRTRVGAHSLASFLSSLKDEQEEKSTDNKDIIIDFSIGTSGATSQGDSGSQGEITSIQVPTGAQYEDAHSGTTGTGTSTLSAELREVTVMAMEFVGPPAPDSTVDRFRSIITSNGGIVIEARNDLVLSIFGLEIADGRDTLDAIDTALKLQRAALMVEDTVSLQIGVGVHPAKIVLLASGEPREDDAFFNAVSLARSLAKRGIGWVVTSDPARQIAAESFRFEDVTVTTIEGTEHTVCKVLERRPVAESYGRLFGRREELRTIGEILAMVSRGTGRILNLVGEGGTGKTRIMHEMRRRLVTGGHDVGWYEAICLPWRYEMPFSAVGAMFRSILAVGEIEPEEELRARIERLRELGLIPEEIEAVSVLLGAAGDSDVGPEERSRQLRSALVRAASSLCSDKLTIFFWDDLNYADKESFAIFQYLSDSLSHMPFLLAFASRPGLTFHFGDTPNYHEIGLNPLSEHESKRLALSRMGARRAAEDLLMDVALKSGGNPLYIEEYIKALLANEMVKVRDGKARYQADAGALDFPKTLRGLVGARINRLPVEQRGLLQRAAVLGQRFHVEIFSRVTGIETTDLKAILLGLRDIGLLTRLSASEFAFSSDLVRDVVYDGIVLSDKREIHALVATSIEEMFADRIDEFVERLAVHYREGGERAKAVDYLIRAGEKVAEEYSHEAAIGYFLQALELLQNVPRPDLNRILSVYVPIGELAIKTNNTELGQKKMRLAEELAEEVGDTHKLIQIMRLNAELQARAARYQEAQQYFQRAIELADETGDIELRCEVRLTAGQVYILLGDMKKSGSYYQETIDIYEDTDRPDLLLTSYVRLARAQALSNEPEQALTTLEKAETLFDAETHPLAHIEFEYAMSNVYYMLRDMERSIFHCLRAVEIGKEYDLKDMVARNAHNAGDAYLGLGDYRKAFTYLRMSLEMARGLGDDVLINLNNIFLAFIDALKFGSNEGLAQLEKALDVANERNTVWEQIQVHFFLGRIHFERKHSDLAKSHLEQSIRIGQAADNKIYEAPAMDLLDQIRETEDWESKHTPSYDTDH